MTTSTGAAPTWSRSPDFDSSSAALGRARRLAARSSGSSRACRSSACSLGRWPRRCNAARSSSSTIDSLAYRRERRRAARRLRRLRPPRASGRHGARARDEGAAPPRRGGRDRGRRRRARSGSRRRARTSRPAAAAASRISPTRRSSRPRQAWVEDSLRRIAGIAEPPLEPIVAGRGRLRLPQQDGVLVRARPRRRRELGLHRAGRWDEVLEIERCWLTTDLGNAIRNTMRDWAREERLPAVRPGGGRRATSATSCSARGANTGQALVQLVTHERERFDRERLIEVLTAFPRGAVDPLVGQRHAGRGDEPADASCSGATRRSRRSSAACASACARTRSCRRTRAWPSGSTSSRATRPG